MSRHNRGIDPKTRLNDPAGTALPRSASTSLTGSGAPNRQDATGPLTPGEPFGSRYHIIRLLGVGGMGAVYQAWDEELGIAVAIKTVRSDTSADPEAAAEIERRFKRELLLARQVTHPNVVRIHDLGELNGIKYITMPFVNGQDLATILSQEGRLPVERVLAIFKQVVSGMEAAHAAGVVHRDLKPANIMVEDDHVFIMDFGIARSLGGGTMMTVAGGVLGTLDYMAPEQATGQEVDARADIYALGLILHDVLVGRSSRLNTGNPLSDLMMRLQGPPPTVRAVDPSIPEPLDRIIARCLQRDPNDRFQTTTDLATVLATLDRSGGSQVRIAAARPASPSKAWATRAAIAALVVVVAAGTWWWTTRFTGTATAARDLRPVSVLVANFSNRTGDDVFDGVLEQALTLGIEGATFINPFPRQTALRVAREIAPDQPLDEERARLVAVREGIDVVLGGVVESDGSGYRITVRGMDPATGANVAEAETRVADKAAVLPSISALTDELRRDLGDAEVDDGEVSAETFTAANLEAANVYVRAQDLAATGRFADAITLYQEAVQRDPNFGRAYAGWATAAYRLGRPDEAEGLWKKAITFLDRMTEREKYRTLGNYYIASGNHEQAVQNFQSLLERYPVDGTARNNLAVSYFNVLDFRRAAEEGRKAVDLHKTNLNWRTNLALYAMYASDLQTGVSEAQEVLKLGAFDKAHLPLAVAALVAGKPDEAAAAYRNMAKVSARGASIASMGLADLSLYKGEDQEARAELERGAAADAIGNQRSPRGIKLVTLAELDLASGNRADAVRRVEEALTLSTTDAVVIPATRLLIAAGETAKAARMTTEFESQFQKRRRAYAAVLRAELALKQGRAVEALDALIAARNLADLWLVRYVLGRVYVEAGRYAEGLAELDAANNRVGEAAAVFLDDWPTFRYTVPLPYWLARAQEGLGLADSAAKNYQAYLTLRGASSNDPLAVDARRRTTR